MKELRNKRNERFYSPARKRYVIYPLTIALIGGIFLIVGDFVKDNFELYEDFHAYKLGGAMIILMSLQSVEFTPKGITVSWFFIIKSFMPWEWVNKVVYTVDKGLPLINIYLGNRPLSTNPVVRWLQGVENGGVHGFGRVLLMGTKKKLNEYRYIIEKFYEPGITAGNIENLDSE